MPSDHDLSPGGAPAKARPAYERDAYLTEIDTRVLDAGADEAGAYVVLADTVLYAEGGGQPADTGTLDDESGARFRVLGVRKTGDETRHYLSSSGDGDDAPVHGDVHVELDWSRRYDHMRQHSAQHLLSAVAEDRYGWRTTSFHLGATQSDIELDVAGLETRQLVALEDEVAAQVRAARPLSQHYVDLAGGLPAGVRSRGLPEGYAGPVRLVEIEGVDLCACGGTHVRSTSELEMVKLLDTEPMRGGTRVYFVAGDRARRRLAEAGETLSELRRLLGVPEEELVAAAAARIEKSAALARQFEQTEAALAEAHARRLTDSSGGVAFERLPGSLVTKVAQAVSRLDADKAVVLAEDADAGTFTVAAGTMSQLDVQAAGSRIAEAIGGRGGGSGRYFQGRSDRLDAIADIAGLVSPA